MATTQRLFTPAEANRTLPLVRRIVVDILATGKALRGLSSADPEGWNRNPAATNHLQELQDLMLELANIGCSYRDWNFEVGLIDFPSMIDDEEVLLCWRSDEPEIGWYHGVNAGFAGRRPIPSALLASSDHGGATV